MTINFPPALTLATTPTPLIPLDRLSKLLGGPRIWVKRDDLTGSLLSGNKVRKLNYVVAQALQEGCDSLITCGGVQSNHCRATAIVGAQLGLDVCLILREDFDREIDGNLFLDYLVDADIHIYSKQQHGKSLPSLLREHKNRYLELGKKPYVIPTGASDEVGVWGYIETCRELVQDFSENNLSPKTIYVATGSGGTQAGLTVGVNLFGISSQVVGVAVCDSEAYFNNKVRSDLLAWKKRYNADIELDDLSINVNESYIGPGYAIAEQEVFETIALVAKMEGLVLDPVYTGKAFHGMISEIKLGNHAGENDIVFVHTGGHFGLFAQKQAMIETLKLTKSY